MLLAFGCVFLIGCTNPIDRTLHSIGSVSQAIVKCPVDFAERSVEKAREKRLRQEKK